MGLPPEEIDAAVEQERAGDPPFEVFPDNWVTAQAFMALTTQWRVIVGERVAYQGIDYAAIGAVLAMSEIPDAQRAEVFAGLRVMERAALPILNSHPEE